MVLFHFLYFLRKLFKFFKKAIVVITDPLLKPNKFLRKYLLNILKKYRSEIFLDINEG